jgi:hypothetical protein
MTMNTVELDLANRYWEGVWTFLPLIIIAASVVVLAAIIITPITLVKNASDDAEYAAFVVGFWATLAVVVMTAVIFVGGGITANGITKDINIADIEKKIETTYGVELNYVTASDLWSDSMVETNPERRGILESLGSTDILQGKNVQEVRLWIVGNEYVLTDIPDIPAETRHEMSDGELYKKSTELPRK